MHVATSKATTKADTAPVETAVKSRGAAIESLQQVPLWVDNSLPAIQFSLRVNTPGDKFEREADQVADQVMRMPAIGSSARGQPQGLYKPDIQRKISAGPGPATAPPVVHQTLQRPGRPLDPAIRTDMESRFGHDFAGIRLHNDGLAAESAAAVNARAYTAGPNIVFGAGEYAPHTATGRRLLAHELSHSIQQGASQTGPPPAVQRKMKFELQTRNLLWRRKPGAKGKQGDARPLAETTSKAMHGRKFGPQDFLRKGPGDKGTELQSETDGVIEFETDGWFGKWSKLEAHIQQAVDMVNTIVDKKNLIEPSTLPTDQRSNPRFRWPWKSHQDASRLNRKTRGWMDSLRPGETFEVEVLDKEWFAAIQSSEEITIDQYASLMKEHEREPGVAGGYIEATLKSTEEILKEANRKTGLAAAEIENLKGFLQIIINYIIHGQRITGERVVKATFRLMSRTSFSSMFDVLLSEPEKELFRSIVKDRLIFKTLKLDERAKLFAGGIKGQARNLSIQTWLDTIIKPVGTITRKGKKIPLKDKEGRKVKRDRLSHGLFGVSHAMGAFDVDPKKKVVRFEVRGTRAGRKGASRQTDAKGRLRTIRDQPLVHWVDYAESIFAQAATCRGTRLDYDQPDATRRKESTPDKCP